MTFLSRPPRCLKCFLVWKSEALPDVQSSIHLSATLPQSIFDCQSIRLSSIRLFEHSVDPSIIQMNISVLPTLQSLALQYFPGFLSDRCTS